MDSNNLFKNVLIEIRPRLQSANVFIKTEQKLLDFDINITSNNLEITLNNNQFSLPVKDVKIVPDSLCNLQVNDSYVSFRFLTDSVSNFGSFKSEVLRLKEVSAKTQQETFLQDDEYILQCGNCLQEFSESLKFKRILPLPSENSEPSDWFCHAHTTNVNLNPKIDDIFYSHCYAHVNSSLLNGIIETTNNLTCKRCLYWLGLNLHEHTYKIWFHTVIFKTSLSNLRSNALTDCFITLRNVLQNTLLTSLKILLHCQISSSKTNYILLWVVEKRLNIYLNDNKSYQGKDTEAAKVLFKFLDVETEEIKQWKNNVGISNVDVSKDMMMQLLKHLYDTNSFIPTQFCKTNDFYISYVLMYDFN